MIECKNCGKEIIKRTALNGSGKTWFEHKPKIMFGIADYTFNECNKLEVKND